jgi:aldehyde:ferredoxin oxidoreductase
MSEGLFPPVRQTPLPGGYMGKLLRVDLTTGSIGDENLPEEPILRKFIGRQALASYILMKELSMDASPFGPESVVVIMTGPITGTGLTPGGTKTTTVYLSPMTERTLGRGATSGFWGVSLKAAGYDGVIITGKAPSPTYLFINEGRLSLRDARKFWGKGTRATEDLLRDEIGLKDAKVMCIGPAGENLVRGAMLVNDANHNAAHSGGAIFGSKNLKAIVVHGIARPRLHDKQRLIEAGLRWRDTLNPRKAEGKKSGGHALDLGALPNFNFRSSFIEDHARGFDQNRVVLRPCFQCQQLCPWDVEIQEGVHQGMVGHFNAGSEWLDAFFNLGIKGSASAANTASMPAPGVLIEGGCEGRHCQGQCDREG